LCLPVADPIFAKNKFLPSSLKSTPYIKAKNLVTVLLLLAYGTSCMSPYGVFDFFSIPEKSIQSHQQNSSDSPFQDTQSPEDDTADKEDKFSEDDENVADLFSISFSILSDSDCFHKQSCSLLPGSNTPPFLPPELL